MNIQRIETTWLTAAVLILSVALGSAVPHLPLQEASRADVLAALVEQAQHFAILPWQYGALEQAGLNAMAQGQVRQALTLLLAARQHRALSAPGLEALAEGYGRLGDEPAAITAWSELISSGQATSSAARKAAQNFRQRGDYLRAAQAAQQWAAREPSSAHAHLEAGLLLMLVDAARAEDHLRAAANLEGAPAAQASQLLLVLPAMQSAHPGYQQVQLGRALADLGHWDLAESAFGQAARLAPDYAEAWAFWGEARQHVGQDGWTELQRAMALDPGSVAVQALAALYHRRAGDARRSLELFTALSRQQPGQPVWYVEAGASLLDLGQLPAALNWYQAAAQVKPSDPTYWRILAQFCAQHQVALRQVGLPAARQALTLAPEDPAALDVMGEVMAALEDLSSAQRFFNRALKADARFAPAHLHLAQVLVERGEVHQARAHLEQVLELARADSADYVIARRLLHAYPGAIP